MQKECLKRIFVLKRGVVYDRLSIQAPASLRGILRTYLQQSNTCVKTNTPKDVLQVICGRFSFQIYYGLDTIHRGVMTQAGEAVEAVKQWHMAKLHNIKHFGGCTSPVRKKHRASVNTRLD